MVDCLRRGYYFKDLGEKSIERSVYTVEYKNIQRNNTKEHEYARAERVRFKD